MSKTVRCLPSRVVQLSSHFDVPPRPGDGAGEGDEVAGEDAPLMRAGAHAVAESRAAVPLVSVTTNARRFVEEGVSVMGRTVSTAVRSYKQAAAKDPLPGTNGPFGGSTSG